MRRRKKEKQKDDGQEYEGITGIQKSEWKRKETGI